MNYVVFQQEAATTRLSELGLTEETLREAVLAGELARSSCSANDPSALPGLLAWGRTTRAMRERLIPFGWRRSEDGKLSTVIDPSGTIAIAVTTGDQGTGQVYATPRTKYPKGPATVAAVQQNRRQLDMFETRASSEDSPRPLLVTWLLLLARSGNQIHWELSLPGYIGEDERVETWAERIVFAPISTEPTPDLGKVESPATVEVIVERKAF